MIAREPPLLIAAVAAAAVACGDTRDRQPPSLRTLAAARMAAEEDALSATVKFGGGHLRAGPAAEGMLYGTRLVFDETRFRPIHTYDAHAQHLEIGIDARRATRGLSRDGASLQELDLAVSPDVPASLVFELGMAGANIQLGGISLWRLELVSSAGESSVAFDAPNQIRCSELSVKAGAAELRVTGLGNARCQSIELKGGVGDVTLDFTGDWMAGESTSAEVKLGIGALVLRFPPDLGVEIEVDRFVASIEAPGMVRQNNRLVSENYERADSRLMLSIATAFGDIKVVWVE